MNEELLAKAVEIRDEKKENQNSATRVGRLFIDVINKLNPGYGYMGMATSSVSPAQTTQKCFYLASSPGTYVNFGALVVKEGEIAYLLWDGISWRKETFLETVNDLTTGGADKALSAEMGKELDGKLTELEIGMKYADVEHTSISDDGFYVCDNQGNIIAKIDKNGLKTVEVEVNGEKLTETNTKLTELETGINDIGIKSTSETDDVLYVCDNKGNVIAKIDKNGLKTVEVEVNGEKLTETNTKLTETNTKLTEANTKLTETNTKLTEANTKLDELETVIKYFGLEHTSISDDVLYVCDNKGNVIARIDKNGLKAVEVEVNGKKLSHQIDEVVQNFYKNIFYITDSGGNVIAKIGKDGIETSSIKANKFLRLDGTGVDGHYEKYELFTLGDSLSQSGVWQSKCAEILGCKFSQERNIKGGSALSVGGTQSFGSGFDCMPWRAKHLIDAGYIEGVGSDAIIILENVNDGAKTFDPSAKAFSLSDPIEGYAYDDFGTALLASIPADKRKLDACFRLTKVSAGKNLAITALPTKEGDITLNVGWAGPGYADYNIHVIPQSTDAETKQYILDRILEYNFSSVTDTLDENDDSINFSNGSSDPNHEIRITFTDTDNTGMKVKISETTTAKTSVAKFFKGSSLDEWEDVEAWQEGLTYSEGWKTTIEMLQLAFPDAKIIVSMFPSLAYTANDYKLPNGMFDVKSYYDSVRISSMRVMRTNLSAIADFYNLPFADVFKDCGISISNMTQFYEELANVHPKKEGYKRWGETISAIIKRFV